MVLMADLPSNTTSVSKQCASLFCRFKLLKISLLLDCFQSSPAECRFDRHSVYRMPSFFFDMLALSWKTSRTIAIAM